MIFVWSSSGGPFLQCVSLLLFLIQFLPHLLPERWGSSVLFEASSPSSSPSSSSSSVPTTSTPTSTTTSTTISTSTTLLLAVVMGVSMLFYGLHNNEGYLHRIRGAFVRQPATAAVSFLAVLTTVFGTIMLLGSTTPFTGDVMPLFMILLQVVGVVMFLHNMTSQIMLMRRQQQGEETNNNNDNNDRRIREIVDLVLKLPIEEFVSQNRMASCSVAQLRQMYQARDASGNAVPASFVEKQDLVRAVRERRNYNDNCCICCEDYQVGDPLRVLPKCRHEFHVECLDQWAYTFANKRNHRNPTCPLCKTPLW